MFVCSLSKWISKLWRDLRKTFGFCLKLFKLLKKTDLHKTFGNKHIDLRNTFALKLLDLCKNLKEEYYEWNNKSADNLRNTMAIVYCFGSQLAKELIPLQKSNLMTPTRSYSDTKFKSDKDLYSVYKGVLFLGSGVVGSVTISSFLGTWTLESIIKL